MAERKGNAWEKNYKSESKTKGMSATENKEECEIVNCIHSLRSIKSAIASKTDFIIKVRVIPEPSPGQDSARDKIQACV